MKKLWFATLGVVAIAATLVYAQVAQNQVSGNECWNAGQGPGGPSSFLCINLVRNGTAIANFSGSGSVTTGATQQNSTLMWTGTAPTTWTINLPNPAFDGEIITVGTDTTLTTLVTVQTQSGTQTQTMNAAFSGQTVTASTSVEWQYVNSASKWFRLR